MKTYTIAKDLLPLFEEKLEKFAKKFEKYGSYTYKKLDEFICEDKNDRRYGYTLINIELDATYKLGDYEFVASLEWVEDDSLATGGKYEKDYRIYSDLSADRIYGGFCVCGYP